MRLATCRRDRLLGCFFLTKTLPYYRPTPKVATPSSAALDSHFFSEANVNTCQARGIDSNIITGRELNHRDWHTFFSGTVEPPAEEASAKIKIVYQLLTEIGQAIYRLRKCTVEPVIGIIIEPKFSPLSSLGIPK